MLKTCKEGLDHAEWMALGGALFHKTLVVCALSYGMDPNKQKDYWTIECEGTSTIPFELPASVYSAGLGNRDWKGESDEVCHLHSASNNTGTILCQ